MELAFMKKSQKPTLSTVAELAGVSVSAVSMIMSGREGVSFSPETVAKVMAAAKELGYSSKVSKKSEEAREESHTILAVSPNVSNPYYAAIIQAIEQSAKEKDYDVLIYNTYRSPEDEARLLSLIEQSSIAGVIFAMIPSALLCAESLSRKMPVVCIGDRDSCISIDTIETSNFAAGELLAEHLLNLGHKKIAYISTTLDKTNSARTKRLEGLKKVFQDGGSDTSVLVKSRNVTPLYERNHLLLEHSIGYELCRDCLQDKEITAFVGVNDMVCYGIMDAISDAGYRIPEDYSVGGFDNNFPSSFSAVSLTTVDHYIEDKGHNAFEMLYEKMTRKDSSDAPQRITRIEYKQHLVVRRSTGPARAADCGNGGQELK